MLRRLPVLPDDGPVVEIALDAASVDELVAAEPRPAPEGRPWVAVNMVSSVDGSIQVDGVSGPLGGDADFALFVALRAACDVILAGSTTVTAERYRPPKANAERRARRIARGQAPVPRIAVVSNRGDIDLSLPMFADASDDSRPIVLVADRVADARRGELDEVADVLVVGDERVDPRRALRALASETGATMVLMEGGATLNGVLLGDDLVDEWCLTLAPMVVAGEGSRSSYTPDGGSPRRMQLVRALEYDGELLLRYVRDRSS